MVLLLITLFPFIFILYNYFFFKKRESISFGIKHGLNCYSCKSAISTLEDLVNSGFSPFSDENKEAKLCKSCERDEKLCSLTDSKSVNKTSFKRFLISDKSKKLQSIFLYLGIFFIIIDLIFRLAFDFRYFVIITSLFNSLFWLLFIGRNYVTTIKSDKQKKAY